MSLSIEDIPHCLFTNIGFWSRAQLAKFIFSVLDNLGR